MTSRHLTGKHLGAGPTSGRRSLFAWILGAAVLPFAKPAGAKGWVVEMHKMKFAPAEIEVPAGSTITFVNKDLVPHTATAADKSFDTGTIRGTEQGDLTFPAAGEFPYICKFHPHMKGKVVVR